MKKIAGFIVKRYKWILAVMLVITAVCGALFLFVGINTDMTKYLSKDSRMKQGIDIMQEEFPDTADAGELRVMMQGLPEDERKTVAAELENIEGVSLVGYEEGDSYYNKDDYCLFELTTDSDFDTQIEEEINENYADYAVTIQNASEASALGVPVILCAIGLLLIILFVMCESWIEPVIFLITIGIAVIINMGTNIVFGYVSNTTFSIAAILQLVLSMDYSIILMNRFRQELEKTDDKLAAMKEALINARPSILGSAFTTFAGLLMLVFMNFKIGAEIGLVLAKGIICSLICIFTVLPALAIIFRTAILKSAKKSPVPSTNALARFSYKCRFVILPVFVALLIGSFILSQFTKTSYSLATVNPVEEKFPSDNSLVLLFENTDADKVQSVADALLETGHVKSETSYETLLRREYTSDKMAVELEELSDDMEISGDMFKILYYYYGYKTGETGLPSLTVSELINFIADDVAGNDEYSDYIDSGMLDGIESYKDFASAQKLTQPLSAQELADFMSGAGEQADETQNEEGANSILGEVSPDADSLRQIMALYFAEKGGQDAGRMTLSEFVNFLSNDILSNETYAAFAGSSISENVETLKKLSDSQAVTMQLSAAELAAFLGGIDEQSAQLLYVYYYAQSAGYEPSSMTLSEFVSFLQGSVIGNAAFSSMIDENTASMINMLAAYSDANTLNTQMDSASLAAFLGTDESMVQTVFSASAAMSGTGDLSAGISQEQLSQLAAAAGLSAQQMAFLGSLSSEQLAALVQMSAEQMAASGLSAEQIAAVSAVSAAAGAAADTSQITMSPAEFVSFVLQLSQDPTYAQMIDSAALVNLTQLNSIMQLSLSGQSLTYGQYAELFSQMGASLDAASLKTLFVMRDYYAQGASWTVSAQDAVNFICNNLGTFSSMLQGADESQLLMMQAVINGAAGGTDYSPAELSSLLGADEAQLNQLYLLYIAKYGDTSQWKISVQELLHFLSEDVMTNEAYSAVLDASYADTLSAVTTLCDSVVDGTLFSPSEMSGILSPLSDDVEAETLELAYVLYGAKREYDPTQTMCIEDLLDFINDDVMNDTRFEGLLDDDMRNKIGEAAELLDTYESQLKSEKYAILSISADLETESDETTAFLELLDSECAEKFSGDYYIIGTSEMYRELSGTFNDELFFITILTTIVIFLIVAFTFRSPIVPLILVLVVLCGIYVTVSVSWLKGDSINFLAYIIVECILMGSTIDYAILFTNYYRELRRTSGVLESLKAAYKGSIHTILTSGLILVLVTAVLGIFNKDPAIGPICQTLSVGSLSVILLILFALPGMLAVFDRFTGGKGRLKEERALDEQVPPSQGSDL